MSAYEQVIQALHEQGCHGSRGSFQCPAHSDRQPSLSVSYANEKVLLHCFAGCDAEAIMEALGMTTRDLFDGEPKEVARYSYVNDEGAVQFAKIRYQPKKFTIVHPTENGWEYGMNGSERPLYRLPEVRQAIARGLPIYVCYADDTEVLTPDGWCLLCDLPADASVAQYDEGEVQFVRPLARQVFDYAGQMVSAGADWSALLVTPDHRVLCRWKTRKNGCSRFTEPVTIAAQDVGQQRYLPVAGFRKTLGDDGPAPVQARLLAAWQADGVNPARGFRIGWNLKKERKKERLRNLLSELDISWKEQEFPSTPGWTYLTIDKRDAFLPAEKQFGWEILDWSLESRQALLDEVGYWDGDHNGKEGVRFFTAEQCNADVISAVAATTGWGSVVRRDERPGRPEQGPQWVVNLVPRDWRCLGRKPDRVDYDGKVYCLTVPSGYLVTRRHGKTVVSGNCEGEKDADRLQECGVTATCNFGGASEWRDEYAEYLRGADVIIIADRDQPGLAHAAEIRKSLRDVAKSTRIVQSKTDLPGDDVSDHLDAGFSLDELVPYTGSYKAVSLASLVRKGVPAPVRFNEFLYQGGLHSIAGPPDSGKTTLALFWALALARQGRSVLFLDEEGGQEIVAERLIALGATHADLESLVYIPFPGRSWTDDDIASLQELAGQVDPAMLLIDSSAAFMATAGLDENSASDVTRFWKQVLTPIAREGGAAVLVIDHDGKATEQTRYARGSGAKLCAIDVQVKVTMEKPFTRQQDGSLKFIVTKDRRGYLHRHWDVEMQTTSGIISPYFRRFVADQSIADAPPARKAIYAVLDGTPKTYHEINDAIFEAEGRHLRRETASRELNELRAQGLVDCVESLGRESRWYRVDSQGPF